MSFTLSDGGIQITNTTFLGPTPGAPSITAVTQTGRGEVRIDYTAPVYKGSSVITQYIAVSSPDNLIGTLFTFASGSITISGLTARQTYLFVVYAVNSFGSGATSLSNPIFIYPPEPDEPTGINVSQLGWGANISYSAPLRIGLSAISSYTGISTPGSITGTINQSGSGSLIVGNNTTKLTVGTSYSFTAHATNSYGDSPESNPSSSLVLTRPTADGPTIVSPIQTDLTTAYVTIISPTLTAVQASVDSYTITYNGGSTASSATTTRTVNAVILACRTATATVESAGPYTLTIGGTAPTPATVTYPLAYPFTGAIATTFSGSNYLIGPTKLRLINTGPFSIECWIKPANTTPGLDQCIVQNRDWTGGNTSGFALYLTTTGKIRLDASNGTYNTYPTVITSNSSLPSTTSYALSYTNNSGQVINGPTNLAVLSIGPFTIEAWIKPNALTADMLVVENAHWNGGNGGGFRVYVTAAGKIRLDVVNGTWNTYPTVITSTLSIPIGDYTHVAIVRNSSNAIQIYLNGTLDSATATNSSTFSNMSYSSGTGGLGQLRIGASQTDSTFPFPFNGFISNLRIVPGVAVYTGTFAIPSYPLNATQSAGTNIAAIGPAIPNNGYSVLFNPTTSALQYLTVPYNSIFDIPLNTQWTLECWVFTNSTGTFTIANRNWTYGGNGPTWAFSLNGGNTPVWNIAGTGSATYVMAVSTLSGTLGQWNHYAFTRDSLNVVRIFVNGQVGVTRTDGQAMTNAAGAVYIGISSNLATASIASGHISNLRIVKGQALYTAAFTPSTSPLTTTSQGATASNVILLTCQSATLIDNGTGNGGVGFTISAFGSSSYVNTPMITKHYSPFGTQAVLLAGQSSTATVDNSGFALSLTGSGPAVVTFQSIWYHIAVSRDIYDVIRMFINGVSDSATITYPASLSLRGTSTTGNPGPTFRIGAIVIDGTASSYYTGLLSDLRIIQGYYRSSNFSLPTALSSTSQTLSNVYPILSLPNNTHTFTGASRNIYGDGPAGTASSPFIVNNSQIAWVNTSTVNAISTTWTVPAGVYSISAVVIGGGGGGGYKSGGGAGGGGGGGLTYANNITVNPGEVLTIRVAFAGAFATASLSPGYGGSSSITRASTTVLITASSGYAGSQNANTAGAQGVGGNGTIVNGSGLNVEGETVTGYSGKAGNGGSGTTNGQGGSAATYTAQPTTTLVGISELGSAVSGVNGVGGSSGSNGGPGVVRIVWPGEFRKYPDTNVSTNL